MSSGYEDINTDYVYGYLDVLPASLIPYINFPYPDALTAIQEIIKYGSALKLMQSLAGYHWIVGPYSYIFVAPVNDHSVYGVDDESPYRFLLDT